MDLQKLAHIGYASMVFDLESKWKWKQNDG
jgi:hypothetical protein